MHSKLLGATALAGLARMASAFTTTEAYTDLNTGIEFQRYLDSTMGYSFGLAAPENPTTDFIGQLVVPITSDGGWGAVAMGSGMTGKLLIVAWADGEDVVSSFRLASAYSNPDVYSNGTLTALPIADGTWVNSTHFSYTFVCEGCVVGGSTTWDFSSGTAPMGYAVASSNPTTPSDSSSALTYHDVGANIYVANLTAAQSSQYATWASWGSAAVTSGSGSNSTLGGSNSTTGTITNSTTAAPTTLNNTYDVIVVGGGASGIIAAERLAESGVSVLLIERGPANTVALGSTQGLSWNSSLTPYDVAALGSSLTSISGTKFCSDTASTAGCLLGGSSSINGLNFIHPPSHDFERWPTGWNWDDISAAADRLYERNPGTTLPSADGKHYDDTAYTALSAYLTQKGWTEVDSIESPDAKQSTFSRPAWSISHQLRAGPARTYMPFVQQLDNFTLKLSTKVVQVRRSGSTITGVLTQADDGTQQIINLNKNGKVVLAAGALSTPRVLWNSGIGRSDALTIVKGGTSGVTLPDSADWIDLPVGHNLQDHAQVPLQFTATPSFTAFDFSGLASSPVTSDLTLFEAGSGTITQAAQRMHLWTSYNTSSDGRVRYLQGTVSAMADNTVTVKVFLTHGTSSRGELGISSSGSTVLNTKPWLLDDDDMTAFSNFIQWFVDTCSANSTTTSSVLATNTSASTLAYVTPGAQASDIISSLLVSGDHWVGTARMGTDDGRVDNGTSVVDADTRIYGTDNLFVVDASIHPDLPTGNTQAIIMVVAEQAAAKIAAYDVANWNSSNSTSSAGGSSSMGSSSGSSSVAPTSTASKPASATSSHVTSVATSAAASATPTSKCSKRKRSARRN
jgi:cellobiose dehydrogenase (acceptor)